MVWLEERWLLWRLCWYLPLIINQWLFLLLWRQPLHEVGWSFINLKNVTMLSLVWGLLLRIKMLRWLLIGDVLVCYIIEHIKFFKFRWLL